MTDNAPNTTLRRGFRLSPWLLLGLFVAAAVWHTIDFPEDVDPEYPAVVRPTFSRRPPPAYRLAEPGDTLDRMAIYFSAGSLILTLIGCAVSRGRTGLWPAGVALSAAALWHASTPGPTYDGWHGLGWRAMFDPSASSGLRIALGAGALGLAGVFLRSLLAQRTHWAELWGRARGRGMAGLLITALILVMLRQVEIPGVEPVGFWPRWALVWGLTAFDLALIRALPALEGRHLWLRRGATGLAGAAGWLALVLGGIWLTWYHRPLERLRAIVSGKIFISAMPTRRGLEIAHRRHHFKTIVNLFPEDSEYRSSRLPEELAFVKKNNIQYVLNNSDPAAADAFLDQTLALAQDPNAWPILVHCHACQDRTPAWWGIYRFVVLGESLADIMRDIERHRGYRPKASVTLLYNHVLPPRAPERYRNDPTAALLRRCAAGSYDPYASKVDRDGLRSNRAGAPRVSRRTDLDRHIPRTAASPSREGEAPTAPRERSRHDGSLALPDDSASQP